MKSFVRNLMIVGLVGLTVGLISCVSVEEAQRLEDQVQERDERIAELTDENEQLQSRLSELEDQLANLEEEAEALRSERDDLQSQLEVARNQRDRLQDQRDELRERVNQQEERIAELEQTEQQLAELQDELETARSEQDRLRTQLDLLRNQRDRLRSERDELRSRVQEQEQRLAELEGKEQQLAQLREELDRMQAELEEIEEVDVVRREDVLTVQIGAHILFDTLEADLRDDARDVLDDVGEVVTNYSDREIRFEGHADSRPIEYSPEFENNWELAAARALTVLEWFQNNTDLSPERMGAVTFGEHRPLVPNLNPDNMQLNRRVEIVLYPPELPEETRRP